MARLSPMVQTRRSREPSARYNATRQVSGIKALRALAPDGGRIYACNRYLFFHSLARPYCKRAGSIYALLPLCTRHDRMVSKLLRISLSITQARLGYSRRYSRQEVSFYRERETQGEGVDEWSSISAMRRRVPPQWRQRGRLPRCPTTRTYTRI
jgi:hypothetical protein